MTGTLSALLLNKWDLKTTLFLAECFPFTYKTTKRKSRNAAKYNPTGLYLGELPQKARESSGQEAQGKRERRISVRTASGCKRIGEGRGESPFSFPILTTQRRHYD